MSGDKKKEEMDMSVLERLVFRLCHIRRAVSKRAS